MNQQSGKTGEDSDQGLRHSPQNLAESAPPSGQEDEGDRPAGRDSAGTWTRAETDSMETFFREIAIDGKVPEKGLEIFYPDAAGNSITPPSPGSEPPLSVAPIPNELFSSRALLHKPDVEGEPRDPFDGALLLPYLVPEDAPVEPAFLREPASMEAFLLEVAGNVGGVRQTSTGSGTASGVGKSSPAGGNVARRRSFPPEPPRTVVAPSVDNVAAKPSRLDRAIEMLEDFVDSGDASKLLMECRSGAVGPSAVSLSPASLIDWRDHSNAGGNQVDPNVLDKAIDLLEVSLLEDAELYAQVADALTFKNWVIPAESLAGQLPAPTGLSLDELRAASNRTDKLPELTTGPVPPAPLSDFVGHCVDRELETSAESPSAARSEPSISKPILLITMNPGPNQVTSQSPLECTKPPSREPVNNLLSKDTGSLFIRPNFTIVSQERELLESVGQSDSSVWMDDETLPPIVATEGIIRAVRSLEAARELSIADDNFVGLQDQAFGQRKAEPESDVPQENREDFLKSGERANLRQSQEFLRVKSDSQTNAQELSQKLRALPLPSPDEKREKDKPVALREMILKKCTKFNMALVAGLFAVVCGLAYVSHGADDYLRYAAAAYNRGDYLRCIQGCQNAIRLNPRLSNAHIYMARCYAALERRDDALQKYSDVLSYDKTNFQALQARAGIYGSRGDWGRALADYRAMLNRKDQLRADDWM
jgi:hypothetical protein